MVTYAFEYRPKFSRYPPQISHLLSQINEALGAIRSGNVLPAVADELRSSARIGTVHYSNLIEGNPLPIVEAERASQRKLDPTSKAKLELVNYVNALDLIDSKLASGLDINPELLLELHGEATRGIGDPDDPYFKPHHEGAWRDGEAKVVDQLTRQVLHEGVPQAEVEERMAGVFEWVNRHWGKIEYPPFILAGAVHHAITDIHPFADGNGRVARLMQAAMLMKAGVLPGRMFSFERFYAEDKHAYYESLRSVGRNTRNMEEWLTYFLTGLHEEYERVRDRVRELNELAGASSSIQLSPSQQKALLDLQLNRGRIFSRRDYEELAGVSRATALSELRELVKAGVLNTQGSGPSTKYAVNGRPAGSLAAATSGRPRQWTEERILEELEAFVVDRDSWPSPSEFAAAGKSALYVAASRNGGVRTWRTRLGL